MATSWMRAAVVAAALTIALPAAAQQVALRPDSDFSQLRAGEYAWFDTPAYAPASLAPADDAVSIIVSISQQRAYVYRGSALIGATTVSTGKPGKDTPTGEFTILEKKKFHRSNLYSNAPMPHMQRLTWDGIALHAGQLPGYPASHGCIRLPPAFARELFAMTELGATVWVVDYAVTDPTRHDYLPSTVDPVTPLTADAHALGGEAFNVVTAGTAPVAGSGPRPAEALVPASGSWVAGSARPPARD